MNADDLVLAGGEPGRAWLELHRPGGPVQQLTVGGSGSRLYRSADRRHALVITAVEGGHEARWLTRTDRGWQPVGAPRRVTGPAACVAPDGARALLLGGRPAVLDREGDQRELTDLESAGDCAWTGSGGIVAELSMTGTGLRSRLRVFDARGAVRWRLDTTGEAAVSADPTGARVAYVVERKLHRDRPGARGGAADDRGDPGGPVRRSRRSRHGCRRRHGHLAALTAWVNVPIR